jgi:hypothetical protein
MPLDDTNWSAPAPAHANGQIELTAPRDLGFCRIAQGAIVNSTILPSGYKTPPVNMMVKGHRLIPIPEAEEPR